MAPHAELNVEFDTDREVDATQESEAGSDLVKTPKPVTRP